MTYFEAAVGNAGAASSNLKLSEIRSMTNIHHNPYKPVYFPRSHELEIEFRDITLPCRLG
jgi:hypothetical protein